MNWRKKYLEPKIGDMIRIITNVSYNKRYKKGHTYTLKEMYSKDYNCTWWTVEEINTGIRSDAFEVV